jgi:hypothetical protein
LATEEMAEAVARELRFSRRMFLVMIATACISACNDKPPELSPLKMRIAKVGNDYVAQHFPDWDRAKYPVLIKDKSDMWVFEYKLRENMMGGTPLVEIRKRDLTIIRAYREQ